MKIQQTRPTLKDKLCLTFKHHLQVLQGSAPVARDYYKLPSKSFFPIKDALMFKVLITTTLLTLSTFSSAYEHGGGNGGDDLELELKKITMQIGQFVKSDMGSKTFKMLNPDAIVEVTNNLDINIISEQLEDKYGAKRACINEPQKQLITCNVERITEIRNSKNGVLVGLMFHEILGLMELELGFQENVSLYPISSKILPFQDIVLSTPISESQIRPEYYGLDNRSYGVTLVNKDTKETLRVICLNDNVEIHRCRNYSLVRQGQGMQTPAIPEITSMSPEVIRSTQVARATEEYIERVLDAIYENEKNGYEFLTINKKTYGIGICEIFLDPQTYEECFMFDIMYGFLVLPLLDHVGEVGKQVGNAVIYPFKAIKTALRSSKLKSQIKDINENVELAKEVLNQEGDLSLVGTSKKVNGEDWNRVLMLLTRSVSQAKQRANEAVSATIKPQMY